MVLRFLLNLGDLIIHRLLLGLLLDHLWFELPLPEVDLRPQLWVGLLMVILRVLDCLVDL